MTHAKSRVSFVHFPLFLLTRNELRNTTIFLFEIASVRVCQSVLSPPPSVDRKPSWTMEANQADPESIGAGPLNVPPSRFSTPRFHKDRQCFQWSRVISSHDSIVPPPRSGAASVVVQGKLYMFGVSDFGIGLNFFSFVFSSCGMLFLL